VAVAVSDFCRRAEAPASPALVREALACLAEGDDFRVKELTDGEPQARPLGPFAVVDVISGAAAALAADREKTGYYEVARELAQERAEAAPPPEPELEAPAEERGEAAEAPPAQEQPGKKRKKAPAPTVAERIAPKKRDAKAEDFPPPSPPPPATSYLPKRTLPAPRGRYTRLDSPKAKVEQLMMPASRDELVGLLEQVPHRVGLFQALESGYTGDKGPLKLEDVEKALERHHLTARHVEKERASVLGALTDARGAKGRAAHALGISLHELEQLISAAKLGREADELKDRFVREALSPKTLALRIDLLGRTRYLEDLGIEKKFSQALANDLEALLDENADAAEDDHALIALVAKKEGLNAELLEKAVEKLGLITPDEDV
jgi:hypothetical protein